MAVNWDIKGYCTRCEKYIVKALCKKKETKYLCHQCNTWLRSKPRVRTQGSTAKRDARVKRY